MKRIVSVSIGSSKRDHKAEVEFLGEEVVVERIGTDGSLKKAEELIRSLDGVVSAIGLGGIDLYLWAAGRKYIVRDAKRLKDAAKITPVVDGSGIKNTLERETIEYLQQLNIISKDKKILLVSAVDRFGMAEALANTGCEVIYGDFIFSLGLPIPIRSIQQVRRLAKILLPIITKLPFKYLYPTGKKQDEPHPIEKYTKYYRWADIIAGDFHFIKRRLPGELKDKVIITNTLTQADLELLKERGVMTVVTTTPELQGRSFGTNVIEALLVAFINKKEITDEDYKEMLKKLDIKIRIEKLVKL